MAARNRRLEQWAPWVLAVAILVLWQIVCTAFNISDFIFPRRSRTRRRPASLGR